MSHLGAGDKRSAPSLERSKDPYRVAFAAMVLWGLCAVSLVAGLLWSTRARADREPQSSYRGRRSSNPTPSARSAKPRTVYRQKTTLDFEGAEIEGELKKPAEFYFQHRPDEKFDSLVKRRPNFHREMLRDAVLSK